ncbi:MAG: uroporphyrinogen decarboxylase family protein, partial [bacterium]
MQPRDRFIAALERKPPTGRVPHFELVFFLTMEAFRKPHFGQRTFHQWGQMEEKERQLHREDIADLYIAIAERYEHSAIFLDLPSGIENSDSRANDEFVRLVDLMREKIGDRYFLMTHGDTTFSIPDGESMMDFVVRLTETPAELKAEAGDRLKKALDAAEQLRKRTSLDGFALCADYCLNDGPFLSPAHFSEFVTPYLAELTQGYRDMGYYVIKHTDGNIMPIIDQLIETRPHALHSIDPQAGVDIAKVKHLYGDQVCLIGNVNCGLMQTGTEEELIQSARYALQHGMPDGGYIFSTSNCVYTGMPLARYELMLDVWRKEGNYGAICEENESA